MKKILIVAITIGLMTVSSAFAQKGKALFPDKAGDPKLGMVSYTYRHSFQKDVAATLDTIKALGITNMEFSNLFGRTAKDIRAMLDERGMRCTSFGVGYPDLENKIDQVAANAKTLGAEFVRVAWIPHKGDFTLDMAKKTVEDFNRFGKTLKDEHGLTFCYHNHGFEFQPVPTEVASEVKGKDVTLFDYIVQKTDPNNVSFEMDILWTFFPGKNPAEILKRYPNRFKLMHVKDLKKGVQGNMSGGTPVENDVALGTGQLDLPTIMKAADKSSIKYYYIEDESPNISRQVPISIAFLRNLRM
ncbi:sugar phosphate isomerase/epimerase family protein [Telluribacter sp.]|jgi:sugar phosphate isomerase/epimerase|uniref:sugar phosphate isomerase/epimerase family protein n=1 Tax=Telluribacter sp. TaxID=1978767 RepID=UPI002E159020|nr:TIM barrel protein [Telluribacter sp.]